MNGDRDKEFAQFIEKNSEVLKTIAGEGAINLETLWKILVFVFDFNYLAIYETEDGENFRLSFEFERHPLQEPPNQQTLNGLITSAFDQNKPKSRQKERPLNDKEKMVRVEAIAAIPITMQQHRHIIIICTGLMMPKDEVVRGYVFDSYKLQLYMSVIKGFVRVREQQMQLKQSKSQIGDARLAAIAGSVFALLEGLSAIIGIFKASTVREVMMGLLTIGVLIFFIVVIFRLGKLKKLFNIN